MTQESVCLILREAHPRHSVELEPAVTQDWFTTASCVNARPKIAGICDGVSTAGSITWLGGVPSIHISNRLRCL